MSPGLETAYHSQNKRLLDYIRRRVDDEEAAEDILHEVFLKASENLDALAPVDNLTAWLWSAVKNRIVDYYRARSRRRKREAPGAFENEDEQAATLDSLIADSRNLVEDEYLRRELADALYESLDELPEKQREVFLLQAVEGYTFSQIAELTGKSINTLTARKRYAVKFLRRRLEEMREVLEETRH